MMTAVLLSLLGLAGCEADEVATENAPAPTMGVDELGRITKTYYVSNPSAGGCSSALWLQARGTGITSVVPYGCNLDGTNNPAHPTWDSLTSGGVNTLSDTWYIRGTAFDKDNTSASSHAWCGQWNVVTVQVTGTTVTGLSYWFTDNSRCVF